MKTDNGIILTLIFLLIICIGVAFIISTSNCIFWKNEHGRILSCCSKDDNSSCTEYSCCVNGIPTPKITTTTIKYIYEIDLELTKKGECLTEELEYNKSYYFDGECYYIACYVKT